MLNIRPANADDLQRQFAAARARTVRAYAVEADGVVIALIGYYLDNGRAVIFSAINDEARKRAGWYPRAVLRCACTIVQEALKLGMPVLAVADPRVPGSDKLLERVGFARDYKDIFVWKQ